MSFYNCRDDTNPTRADATLSRPDGNTADAAGTGISEAGTEPNPVRNEPPPTNGKDLAKGSTADGRVRKGRGFTQQYSFARKYRTPSPERSPVRSHHYNGGRNDRWGNFNRYGYLSIEYRIFDIFDINIGIPPCPGMEGMVLMVHDHQ
jgi:peptidyl-prolyl isomerase G (cyclophilin G)